MSSGTLNQERDGGQIAAETAADNIVDVANEFIDRGIAPVSFLGEKSRRVKPRVRRRDAV
jgi:hypothetical protein